MKQYRICLHHILQRRHCCGYIKRGDYLNSTDNQIHGNKCRWLGPLKRSRTYPLPALASRCMTGLGAGEFLPHVTVNARFGCWEGSLVVLKAKSRGATGGKRDHPAMWWGIVTSGVSSFVAIELVKVVGSWLPHLLLLLLWVSIH